MTSRNYFGSGFDAERYSSSRPHIHPAAIQKFRQFAHLATPFSRALDVGCGTGQSSVALAEIACTVVGVDASREMLEHAVQHPQVEYRFGVAEAIPLPDEDVDLITAAQAFHWFEPDVFLAESKRLLRSPGWLVIYTSWFTGEMADQSTFARWFRDDFLTRYPTPARNRTGISPALAEKYGLVWLGEDTFSNGLNMSAESFIDYELSTTNIIAAAEKGDSAFDEAAAWMRESLAPFFREHEKRIFRFAGTIWYLQKQMGTDR